MTLKSASTLLIKKISSFAGEINFCLDILHLTIWEGENKPWLQYYTAYRKMTQKNIILWWFYCFLWGRFVIKVNHHTTVQITVKIVIMFLCTLIWGEVTLYKKLRLWKTRVGSLIKFLILKLWFPWNSLILARFQNQTKWLQKWPGRIGAWAGLFSPTFSIFLSHRCSIRLKSFNFNDFSANLS